MAEVSRKIVLRSMSPDLTYDEINIGLGNGLVPLVNKPLPEAMLIQIYLAIKH